MNFLKSIKKKLIRFFDMLTLWDVFSYFSGKDYLKIISVMVLNVGNSFAKIYAPYALGRAVELVALTNEENHHENQSHAFTLFLVSIALALWTRIEIYIKKFITINFEDIVVEQQVAKIMLCSHEISLAQHVAQRTELTKMLMEVINLQSKIANEVVTVVHQVIIDIVVGSIIIWRQYGAQMGIGFLGYCLIDFVLLSHLLKYLTQIDPKFVNVNKKLQRFFEQQYDIMSYEETVRMFNHQDLEINEGRRLLKNYQSARRKFQRADNLISILRIVPMIIANLIPVSFIYKDKISLSDIDDFIFLLTYVNMFGSNLESLNQSLKSCYRGIESIKQLKKFIKQGISTEKQILLAADMLEKPIQNQMSVPEISFENVTFTYPEASVPTLRNISFKIKPGLKVGIIGKSNAGKSTIIKLLFGFFRPQHGAIKLNGHSIEKISTQDLSRIFSCVPQNLDLFRNKSLKYNVLYGASRDVLIQNYQKYKKNQKRIPRPNYQAINNDVNLEAVEFNSYQKMNAMFNQVMHKVELNQLNTSAADEKSSASILSGGQRQRANIARALMRDCPVLLLDEATASLDSFTEYEVLKNIKEISKDKTTMMITHRIATVKDADQIIVLEDGRITEQGDPQTLLLNQGHYYNYCNAQKI